LRRGLIIIVFYNIVNNASQALNNSSVVPAILTASATLVGAFLGAGAAQYFSHWLTIKRENLKGNKESYQKLFAPIVSDVFEYYDISTSYQMDDLKWGVTNYGYLERIFNHIGKNLMFATPEIISAYHSYRYTENFEDNSGFSNDLKQLNLILVFINELIILSEKQLIYNEDTIHMLIKYYLYYYIWIEFTRKFRDFGRASIVLRYDFNLNFSILNKKNYKKIILKYEGNLLSFEREPINLLKLLIAVEEELSRFEHIISDIEDNNDFHTFYVSAVKKPNNLLISLHECTLENGAVALHLEVSNFSDSQKLISKFDFVLQKNHRERSIPVSPKSKGFYNNNNYELEQVNLFEEESERLLIEFLLPNVAILDEYILFYVVDGKKHEVSNLKGLLAV
jgi:hypothetical protein